MNPGADSCVNRPAIYKMNVRKKSPVEMMICTYTPDTRRQITAAM